MAERTRLKGERIDFELTEVELLARTLPDIEKWSGDDSPHHPEPSRVRVTYRAEWRHLMGELELLEHVYARGGMSAAQEGRYRELKALLEDSVPILKRLGFTLPPVPLDG